MTTTRTPAAPAMSSTAVDMLRSRRSRREHSLEQRATRTVAPAREIDPEQEALLADSVGLALLVVLQTLAPAERVAFVLHDMFDLPFDEIAPIVGRTPTAARPAKGHRRVLAASRSGDLDALVALLGGAVGLLWTQGGRPRVAFDFRIVRGKIARIDLIADTERLRQLAPVVMT